MILNKSGRGISGIEGMKEMGSNRQIRALSFFSFGVICKTVRTGRWPSRQAKNGRMKGSEPIVTKCLVFITDTLLFFQIKIHFWLNASDS